MKQYLVERNVEVKNLTCEEFDRAGRDHCRSKRKGSKESNVDIKDRIGQSTGTLLGIGVFI